jgi:hypothetical protein
VPVAAKKRAQKKLRVTAPQSTLREIQRRLEEVGVETEELCSFEGCTITRALRIAERDLKAFHKVLEDI